MRHDTREKTQRAVLVGITLPGVKDSETDHSLDELGRLVKTLGYEVMGRLSQKRGSLTAAAILGSGKMKELEYLLGAEECPEGMPYLEEGEAADVAVFDCELTPSQLSNLQRATGADVFDRTGVIVEIFSRHAKTRAAKLQVETARLKYLAPRVRLTGRGPGDKLNKAGEKTLELDKRRIRDRIAELRKEIDQIHREQSHSRTARTLHNSIALVGYTNAGKSSMMRALTGSSVLVQDKLFATLDTTVRALHPPSTPRILVSDTVGFIKKLPTDLVASFRSTLEEARNATHLLFVVDSSDASFRDQLQTTKDTLASIDIGDTPSHLVLNKIDKLEPQELAGLREEFPDALCVSTKDPKSIAWLRDQIIGFFEVDMVERDVFIAYTAVGAIGKLRAKMRVLQESHGNEGTTFRVRARASDLEHFKASFEEQVSVKKENLV